MKSPALSHKQIVSLIKLYGPTRTVLIEGDSGIGKTAMLYEFMEDPKYEAYNVVSPIDCTQLSDGSVWMPDIDREKGVSRELPNERFGVHKANQKGVNDSRPVIICLDEMAKARQFVKDMLAPIVYERRIGGYHMPSGSITFGCTNLSTEGLGDSLAAHLRNRLCIVRMRKPTKDEWVRDFAVPKGLNPAVIAAAEMFPMVFESFTDYQSGGSLSGKKLSSENPYIFNPADGSQEQVVSPRSLHAASDLLDVSENIDEVTLMAGLHGIVGGPFAEQMMSFIRFGQELPAFSRVWSEPDTCPVPKNPTAQLVQVFQFVTQVKDREQADGVCQYVTRLKNEMQSLFLTTIASSSKIENFLRSETFSRMLTTNKHLFNA